MVEGRSAAVFPARWHGIVCPLTMFMKAATLFQDDTQLNNTNGKYCNGTHFYDTLYNVIGIHFKSPRDIGKA